MANRIFQDQVSVPRTEVAQVDFAAVATGIHMSQPTLPGLGPPGGSGGLSVMAAVAHGPCGPCHISRYESTRLLSHH